VDVMPKPPGGTGRILPPAGTALAPTSANTFAKAVLH
jgi:hypothetical protein